MCILWHLKKERVGQALGKSAVLLELAGVAVALVAPLQRVAVSRIPHCYV